MWEYLDVWDFLAIGLSLFSFWLARSGAPKLKAIAPEKVDEKSLKLRAYGAIVVGLTYLGVHYYMVKYMAE